MGLWFEGINLTSAHYSPADQQRENPYVWPRTQEYRVWSHEAHRNFDVVLLSLNSCVEDVGRRAQVTWIDEYR